MNRLDNNAANQRIAELEAERDRLRQIIETIKADCRELSERIYGPTPVVIPAPKEE